VDKVSYLPNRWDKDSNGNYWDDYLEIYPDAVKKDGVWSIPYNVTGGGNGCDEYPLVYPPFFIHQ
jgi:nitrous oxidase accessory protein NosD